MLRRFLLGVSIVLIMVGLVLSGWQWWKQRGAAFRAEEAQKVQLALLPTAPVPIRKPDYVPDEVVLATVSAQSVYVMDFASASVLIAKNENQTMYPASTTKLMTAVVAIETYPLDTILTASTSALSDGTVLGIQPGDQYSVRDLLAALMLPSANDAAQLLAHSHPQGYTAFIDAMNVKANDLQLFSSTFRNPTGLDAEGQQTTARDLAILARAAMTYPAISELAKTPIKTIFDVSGQKQFMLKNTNALLESGQEFIGIKTGTTELAKELLISQYKTQEHQVVIVVAGSDDRYRDTAILKNWVESTYTWQAPSSATLELDHANYN